MEQAYKISTCRGNKQSHHALPGASCRPLAALLVICLLVVLAQVSARPSDATEAAAMSDHSSPASIPHHNHKRSAEDQDDYYDEDYLRVKRCYEDEDVNELCQRCSKVTKSALVFPMCCSNEDETMDWCKAYVYYGIQN